MMQRKRAATAIWKDMVVLNVVFKIGFNFFQFRTFYATFFCVSSFHSQFHNGNILMLGLKVFMLHFLHCSWSQRKYNWCFPKAKFSVAQTVISFKLCAINLFNLRVSFNSSNFLLFFLSSVPWLVFNSFWIDARFFNFSQQSSFWSNILFISSCSVCLWFGVIEFRWKGANSQPPVLCLCLKHKMLQKQREVISDQFSPLQLLAGY